MILRMVMMMMIDNEEKDDNDDDDDEDNGNDNIANDYDVNEMNDDDGGDYHFGAPHYGPTFSPIFVASIFASLLQVLWLRSMHRGWFLMHDLKYSQKYGLML